MAICRDGDMAPPRELMDKYEPLDSSPSQEMGSVSTRPRNGRGSGTGTLSSPRFRVAARLGSNWAKEGG